MERDHSHRKRRRLQATSTTTSLEDLPEHVIQHIQSFLSHKEALSSSLVCKPWLHAWSTFPALLFRLQRIESTKYFFKFVDKTLERYLHENLIVEKLNLSLDFSLEEDDIFTLDSFQDSFDDSLDKWLQIAGQIGLKKLAISLPEKPIKGMEQKSPRLLSLNVPNKINFHSLRILELLNVCLDQQVIHQLLSSGSNFSTLEKVDILYCTGFKRIKVDNLSSLVEFKLISFPSVTTVDIVDCPRLSSFEYMFLNSPTWRTGWKFNIDSSSFTNLRSLSCNNMDIDDGKFLNKIISKSPCLEKLYMKSLEFLDDIDVSSASLVELSLLDCICIDEVKLHAPKLCLLEYSDVNIPLLKSFGDPDMKTTCKDDRLKTKLLFRWQSVPNTQFFLKLLLFIKISHKIDIKVEPDIAVGFVDGFFLDIDFHLLRSYITTTPRENVEEVSFNTTGFPKDHTSAILDAFFIICFPKYLELRMLTADGHSKEIIELFANQQQLRRKTLSICWCTTAAADDENSQTTKKCWRHCLHEVEIEFIKKEYGEKQWLWLPFPWRLEFLLYVVESAQTICFRLKWG